MPVFSLNAEQLQQLTNSMEAYEGKAGEVINEVLHKQGAELIMENILPLIHSSGRTWKGKKKSATVADPFKSDDEPLAVVVKSKAAYGYLYFPDDGTNTKCHAGEQYFMQRGAEAAAPDILELCVIKLTESI